MGTPSGTVTLHCPRCDKTFVERATKEERAWTKLRLHIKKAHPDYHGLEDD